MKKLCVWLCILIMLTPVAGLALEMTTLPETMEELMAAVPENLCPAPEGVEVVLIEAAPYMMLRCSAEDWPQTTGRVGTLMPFRTQFEYDPDLGAYVDYNAVKISVETGGMGGMIGLGTNADANGWTRLFQLYFDNEAFENLLWSFGGEAPSLVTDGTTTNYMMPLVIEQLKLDQGLLSITYYADRTEVALLDSEGNALVQMTYPDVLPFCSQFAPVNASAE